MCECGTTVYPSKVVLFGVTTYQRVACPTCFPKWLDEQRLKAEQEEIEKRQGPYHRVLAADDMELRRATLDNFQPRPGSEKVLRLARAFAAGLPTPDPLGLLIHGPFGNGKSRIAAALANKAEATGLTVAWVDCKQTLRKWGSLDPDDREAQIQLACNANLLVIDDLGARKPTVAQADWILALVDAFYRRKRPMVVTTNHSVSKLPAALTPLRDGKEDTETTEGMRIVDRIADMSVFVENKATSYRMEQAVQRAQSLKEGQADAADQNA